MKKVLLIIALVSNCIANAQNFHPLQEVDPTWLVVLKFFGGLCVGIIFFLIFVGLGGIQDDIVINAEIVFRENSKAELKGDFEVWPDDRYKHLESGAIIYKRDILYMKNKKYIKKNGH